MNETWTIVSRKQYGPFFAPTGFVGTWQEASDASKAMVAETGREVWVVPSSATEIETETGRVVKIRDIEAERADRKALADLIAYFDRTDATDWHDWLLKGAARFTDYRGTDRTEAAVALLGYFNPKLDAMRLARRRADGYTVTTDPREIRRIILNAHS